MIILDFLLALIEHFSLRVMAEAAYRFKIGDFASTGPVDPKFQVQGVVPPPTILILSKLG